MKIQPDSIEGLILKAYHNGQRRAGDCLLSSGIKTSIGEYLGSRLFDQALGYLMADGILEIKNNDELCIFLTNKGEEIINELFSG